MHAIKPCNSYAARPAGIDLYRIGRSAYKVYFVDIYGRPEPERYEWDRCGRGRQSVIESLRKVNLEGVGAVVAFPHITKVFRFAPSAETIMHVCGYWTPDFAPVDLQREDGFVEFACYAEAIIAADEYRFWAEAETVDQYLGQWSEWVDAPVRNCRKMGLYFAADNQ